MGVLVDLLKVVRQGFVIGTSSYSLKHVERLYLPPRAGAVLSAGGSVVEYQKWMDSGEPRSWRQSPLLEGIRAYNQVDCESLWGLRSWLLDRRAELGVEYVPDPLRNEKPPEPKPERVEAEALAARLVERGTARLEAGDEEGRLDQLVGWLVEYHRREEKPMWWRKFDRHEMTVEERYEDKDCLAGLARTERATWPIKKSAGYEYRFDPAQETKVEAGDDCFVAGTDIGCEVVAMDADAGRVELKVGPGKSLPQYLCLIPNEFVSAEPIKQAVVRYAEAWERGEVAVAGSGRPAAAPAASPRVRRDGWWPCRRTIPSPTPATSSPASTARRSASRARRAPARPTRPPRSSSSCSAAVRGSA